MALSLDRGKKQMDLLRHIRERDAELRRAPHLGLPRRDPLPWNKPQPVLRPLSPLPLVQLASPLPPPSPPQEEEQPLERKKASLTMVWREQLDMGVPVDAHTQRYLGYLDSIKAIRPLSVKELGNVIDFAKRGMQLSLP
jgi:hypothetical protein